MENNTEQNLMSLSIGKRGTIFFCVNTVSLLLLLLLVCVSFTIIGQLLA